jgi:excisionase family DNA binding protein
MPVAELPKEPWLDDILTLPEAAAYLRVPEGDVLKMAREGMMPAQRIGDGDEWRFLRKALNDWIRYGGHPHWRRWPFHPDFFLESPFADELLHLLEQRLLDKLKAQAKPEPGSKEAVMKHFGIWRGDPTAEAMLEDIYKRRAEDHE